MKRILIIAALWCFAQPLPAQDARQIASLVTAEKTKHFTATRKGQIVGWLTLEKKYLPSYTLLIIESSITINLGIRLIALARTENYFQHGELKMAGVRRTINGREKLHNRVKWEGNKAEIVKGNAENTLPNQITNTVASVYFQEPIGVKQVFSEVYLQFIPIQHLGNSVYRSPLPDGGTMTYTYRNSYLVRIAAETYYGTVYFDAN